MKTRTLLLVLTAACLWFIGFMMGRSFDPETVIEYFPGLPVNDTVFVPSPYEVVVPAEPVLPLKPDTIYRDGRIDTIVLEVDTAKIIADYVKENRYSINMFDSDTLGKLTVKASVQYNALQYVGYDFIPVTKTLTIDRARKFTPFTFVSYGARTGVGIGAGMYYRDFGLSGKYILSGDKKSYEVGAYLKF